MYGLAGPLLMSTMRSLPPISIDLKLSPLLEFARSWRNSGSSGWWDAISLQSIPMSPIEATTQLRSAVADSSLAADAVLWLDGVVDEVVEVRGCVGVDDEED